MTTTVTLLDKNNWRETLVTAVDGDADFAAACKQADNSVALEIGDETAWFKLYRGDIIDTEPYVPPFGETFRLVGERSAWQTLARGETSLSESLYNETIQTAGNTLEANRLREALELLVRHIQRLSEAVDDDS